MDLSPDPLTPTPSSRAEGSESCTQMAIGPFSTLLPLRHMEVDRLYLQAFGSSLSSVALAVPALPGCPVS